MLTIRRALCALCFVLALPLLPAPIRIEQGARSTPVLAVIPFATEDPVHCALDTDIVRADLLRYGDFQVLPRQRLTSLPRRAADVRLREWQRQSVDYVAVGRIVRGRPGLCHVHWQLLNLTLGGYTHSGSFHSDMGAVMLAHMLAAVLAKEIVGQGDVHASQLVYVRTRWLSEDAARRRQFELVRAYADGAEHQVLLRSTEPILSPAWSPNGRTIAYTTYSDSQHEVRLLDLATGAVQRVGQWRQSASAPAWSPSGTHLALTLTVDDDRDIYVYNTQTGALARITNHFAIDTEPDWSDDGRHLLFTSSRAGTPQIYQFDLLSGTLTRLTFHGLYNARARYLGGGRHGIVYISRTAEDYALVLQDLRTGARTALSHLDSNESPAVSPDGSTVIYTSHTEKGDRLIALSLATGVRYHFPTDEVRRDASWSPSFHR